MSGVCLGVNSRYSLDSVVYVFRAEYRFVFRYGCGGVVCVEGVYPVFLDEHGGGEAYLGGEGDPSDVVYMGYRVRGLDQLPLQVSVEEPEDDLLKCGGGGVDVGGFA